MDDAAGRKEVWVSLDRRGRWSIEVPDRRVLASCETLDDAQRMAYRYAARRRPAEIVVRDAYYRVVQRELVG